jgi:ABC-type sugar transport system permease subunit
MATTLKPKPASRRRITFSDRELPEAQLALLFIAPTVIIVGAVFLWPLMYSFWLSLNRYNLGFSPTPVFSWFHNYVLIFTDPFYRTDIGNTTWRTMIFTVISVPVELVLGLFFALLLNEEFRGRSFFRSAMIVPYAMLTISSGLVWTYILNPTYGTLNYALKDVGLTSNFQNFLATPITAMGWVVAADVWKTTPFMTLILLASLQTLPSNMYKAAEVDGAGVFQRFFRITLPMLRPAILVALVLRTLGAFRVYDIIYVMTGGGPADSTNVISYYVYEQAFIDFHIGYASAVAYLTTLAMVAIILVYLFVLRSESTA